MVFLSPEKVLANVRLLLSPVGNGVFCNIGTFDEREKLEFLSGDGKVVVELPGYVSSLYGNHAARSVLCFGGWKALGRKTHMRLSTWCLRSDSDGSTRVEVFNLFLHSCMETRAFDRLCCLPGRDLPWLEGLERVVEERRKQRVKAPRFSW